MKSSDWSRVRELFEQAVELCAAEREAFLRQAAPQAEVRREVERLLASTATEDLLRPPSSSELRDRIGALARFGVGDTIGAYAIEGVLGAGGMGTVYRARQERPSRTVALKVMHVGLHTPEALRRFLVEGEILGRMRHPGIAAIFEMGMHRLDAADVELPFFVMEYVEGARDLCTFAEEEGLGLPARLALFTQVCGAVQHAHQRGVIHLDLKPHNILVDASGQPKVIDYGVASVAESGIAKGFDTQDGQVLGTLQYISPEHVESGRAGVDVRSDVYSLGVILYELLADRLPYDVQGRSLSEVVDEICTRVPSPPSVHAPGLARELDWITRRALEKDVERRYDSAAELAADLERFGRNEPVVAGPPTASYRLRKFIARNRGLVAALALAIVGSLLGVAGLGLGLVEAREQQALASAAREAEREQAELARVALRRRGVAFGIVREMLGAVGPEEDGRAVTLFELLERYRPQLSREYGDDLELQADLQGFFASVYLGLGLTEAAAELAEAALAVHAELPRPDSVGEAGARVVLAQVRLYEARYEEVEELLATAASGFEGVGQESARAALKGRRLQAELLLKRGHGAQAIEVYRETAALASEHLGATDADTLRALSQLTMALRDEGQLAEAEELARAVYATAREAHGEDHPLLLPLGMRLGLILQARGKLDELVELQTEILLRTEEVYGLHHRNVASSRQSLVIALLASGALREGEALCLETLELVREHHPQDLELELALLNNFALALSLQEREDEAAAVFDEVIARLEQAGLEGHPQYFRAWFNRAQLTLSSEDMRVAEAAFRDLLALAHDLLPPDDWRIPLTRGFLGLVLADLGEDDEAEQALRSAIEELTASGNTEALGEVQRFRPVLEGLEALPAR